MCVSIWDLCDGHSHCADHFDEKVCFNFYAENALKMLFLINNFYCQISHNFFKVNFFSSSIVTQVKIVPVLVILRLHPTSNVKKTTID